MGLSKTQFEVLEALACANEEVTIDSVLEELGYEKDAAERVINELINEGYVKEGMITPGGIDALEPYRAKRAIFFAAGFGSRMVPITLNTPKPLIRVNGKRIIDTLIDACLENDIDEIFVVRGYLREQFDQLLYKYPMIKFLDNLTYDQANNIGSAVIAKDMLQNSYVFESDLIISNPSIIKKYHYNSDVLGIWKDKTDDWCLDVDGDGFVIDEKVGGLNTYQMVGVYYFNAEDGAKLSGHINEAYQAPGGKEKYWETVPNVVYKGQYKIEVRPCRDEDIVEIDTFDELKAIDKAYNV